jgi:hypothetical protein
VGGRDGGTRQWGAGVQRGPQGSGVQISQLPGQEGGSRLETGWKLRAPGPWARRSALRTREGDRLCQAAGLSHARPPGRPCATLPSHARGQITPAHQLGGSPAAPLTGGLYFLEGPAPRAGLLAPRMRCCGSAGASATAALCSSSADPERISHAASSLLPALGKRGDNNQSLGLLQDSS